MRKFILSLLFTLSTVLTVWANPTFRLSAPQAVPAGQQFRVEYVLTEQGSAFTVDLDGVEGLQVLYGPSSSQSRSTSIINGQMSSEVRTIYTFVVMAEREGSITLPAATVKADGHTLTSNTATVKVLPPDQDSSDKAHPSGGGRNDRQSSEAGQSQGRFSKDDVHLVLDLSKTSAYQGEAVIATLKLYWRNTQMGNPTDVKLPDFEGFTVTDIDNSNAQASLEHYQGANYQMYPLCKWLLFPSRSGEITIPSASLKAVVQVVTTRRSGGFFDWPMESVQNYEVPLTSAPRKVSVRDLPSGRPASYMNAVGNFSIHSELTADHVKTNDAVIYRLSVEGTGNLKYIREPQPEFPSDFEVFDPKVDATSRTSASGLQGRTIIEYTVIPRHSGTFTIPPVEFSYFDLSSQSYKTLTTSAHTLEVERGAEEDAQGGGVVDFGGANQERLRVLGNDIRYRHNVDASDLEPLGQAPFYGTLPYWLCILLPALAFVILAFVYRRRIRRLADVAGTRTRRAGKVAERRLKEARRALQAHDETAFYEAIHKATLGYVGDKLRIPLSDLSQDNILDTLQSHSVTADTLQAVKTVLETCQFARYAPSADAHAMDDLYLQTSRLIDSLESEVR